MMNDIKYYFTSTSPHKPPAGSSAAAAAAAVLSAAKIAMLAVASPSTSSAAGSAPSSPSVNSKQIVENMESVMNSIKKQERRAKRKKRHQTGHNGAAAAPDESEICDILSSSLRFVSPNVSAGDLEARSVDAASAAGDANSAAVMVHGGGGDVGPCDSAGAKRPAAANTPSKKFGTRPKPHRRSHKENTNSCNRTPSTSPPTSGSGNHKSASSTNQSLAACPSTSSIAAVAATTPKKNAFEMLMNARNKSIGTNSPAKDSTASMAAVGQDSPASETKTKRKLLLEAWADRKGASKRRAQDEETGEYVNLKLEKRAKRFKRLLANGQREDETDAMITVCDDNAANDNKNGGDETEPKTVVDTDDEDTNQTATSLNGSYLKLNFKRSGKKKPKQSGRNIELHVFDSGSEDDSAIEVPKPPPPTVSPSSAAIHVKEVESALPPLNILATLRSPPPSKSPHKPARRKSVYIPKTPTKSPRLSIANGQPKLNSLDSIDMVLSSPIKKRDSLLGYFNKVEKSPGEEAAAAAVVVESSETKQKPARKRGRPSRAQRLSLERESTPTPDCETPSEETPSSDRPKRGCRDRIISYKQSAEINELSPAKVAAQKSIKRARRLLSGSPQKTASPGRSPRAPASSNRKLAPIFVKAPVRPALDPETARARLEFLHSGIPEKMRLDIERQKAFVESYTCELDVFPLVSHVRQMSEAEANPQRTKPNLRYRAGADVEISPRSKRKFKIGKSSTRSELESPQSAITSASIASLKLTKPKDLVKELKELDQSKFLYFRSYKQLRRMYDDHKDPESVQRDVGHSDDTDDSVEIIETTATSAAHQNSSNGTTMFSEKYKPTCSDEIIINSVPVFLLKRYLATWQENYAARKNRHRSSSSDSDFDGGSNSASTSLSKAVCLVGPSGSGKTNAVYALANEMNFNVLEMNAGCKRSGKKMMQALQEATQSHQVKSGNGQANGGTTNGGDRWFRNSQQQVVASSEESSSNGATGSGSPKLSLILIEDADIVFEQDNGFVDAIFQLVNTSKRPVILVANRRSCQHLSRFIGANTIDFDPANTIHAGKWLSMLSVAEHRYVGDVECARLYVHNGCNMRRTVLDMQFFLQSGGDRERLPDGGYGKHYSHQRLYETFARPCRSNSLPFPVDFDGLHQKIAQILPAQSDDSRQMEDSLRDSVEFYETMSRAQGLQSTRRRQLDNDNDDGLMWNMTEDVVAVLTESAVERVRRRAGLSKLVLDPIPVRRRETITAETITDQLSTGLVVANTSRRAVQLDTEPLLRAICRSERQRTAIERTNRRFYHYLRNYMLTGNSTSCSFSTADTFERHCDILWDVEVDSVPEEPEDSEAIDPDSDA